MTLDNDGNPNPHAPRLPTDPPPRRAGAGGAQTSGEGVAAPTTAPADAPAKSSDRPDGTTALGAATSPRGVVRAILAALGAAERAAVLAAVLSWARLVMLAAGERDPGARDAAYHAADVMADGPDRAALAAVVAAWWGLSARGVVRDAWRGELGAERIAPAVEFFAGLGDGAGLDATPAPHVLRCPVPAGLDGPVTRAALVDITTRAARELAAMPGDFTEARDMTLAVLGALGGLRAETPAELLAAMGHELTEVASVLSGAVYDERDRGALSFRGRCDAAVAMLRVAADAIRAASALAASAPGEDLDAVTWPAVDA